MKQAYTYLTTLLIVLLFSVAVNAQSSMAWGWGKTIGGTGSESPAAIATDSRNGVYVFGHFSGSITADGQTLSSVGGSDMYLIKYDTTGNLQWAKRFGGTSNEEAKGLKTDKSGNLVLTGNFEGSVTFGTTTLTSTGASDICIVKLQPDGTVVWAKQFTGSLTDKGGALICDEQRNIYTTGTYSSNDLNIGGSSFTAPKTFNVFYCKLDSNGNKIWANSSSSNTTFNLYNFDVIYPQTLLMHGSMGSGGADRINFDPLGIPGLTGMLSITQAVFTVKMDTAGNYINQSISSFGNRLNGGGTALGPGQRVVKAGSVSGSFGSLGGFLGAYDINNTELRNKSLCGCTQNQSALYNIATGKNGNLFSVGFSAGSVNWGGTQQNSSSPIFIVWEVDTSLTTKSVLGNTNQVGYTQYLTKIATDTTTGTMFTAGYFSGTGNTFTVGNNVLPYYGSDDIFVGQIKYLDAALRAYAGNDTFFCAGNSVTIGTPTGATGGTSPYTYSWSPTTGLANPTAASTLATPLANTSYTLTVTDAAGNTAQDDIFINVIAPPTATPTITTVDTLICQGDTATLSTAPSGTYSYNWYNNAAFVTNTLLPSYKTITAGSYTLRFKENATGCLSPASQPMVVTVKPLPAAPTITSSGSGSTCQGNSVVLTSNPQNNYWWSNGATTQSITVTSSGSFTVSTTGANGCSSPLSAPAVVAIGLRPSLGADTVVYLSCYGDVANLLPLYNTTGFTATWNTASPTMVPPGNYRLIASSVPGCADTAFATIKLEVAHWTGNANTDWHTPGNWSTNKVPTAFTHVIISFVSTGDSPVISTANAVVASLQLRNGATLNMANGMTVTIVGNCAVLPPN
jgi:hypothetical protein